MYVSTYHKQYIAQLRKMLAETDSEVRKRLITRAIEVAEKHLKDIKIDYDMDEITHATNMQIRWHLLLAMRQYRPDP